jgi:hypothetical protein
MYKRFMETVLAIDDDETFLTAVKLRLEAGGFVALTASNGIDGIRLARDHKPDLILCDVDMPETDGFGVLASLRADPEAKMFPFIFLTGKNAEADLRRGMVHGAEDYLCKPVAGQVLISSIRSQLDRASTRKDHEDARLRDTAAAFVNTLAHELRTPLCGLLPIPDLIENYSDESDKEGVREACHFLRKSAERLHKAVERFLSFYSIVTGHAACNNKPQSAGCLAMDVAHLVSTCKELGGIQPNREQDLTIEVDMNLPDQASTSLTSSEIKLVLRELVDNAFKFSNRGSPVAVKLAVKDNALRLTVSDRGRGMTDDQVKSIRVLRQFDRSTFEQQGFGLGLATVGHLLAMRGGSFVIKSNMNAGTTVTAQIPITSPEIQASKSDNPLLTANRVNDYRNSF